MRTSFNQNEIKDWSKFASVAALFGFSIRVTGGAENTHDIDASSRDLLALVELAKGGS